LAVVLAVSEVKSNWQDLTYAMIAVSSCLRELTANLMRVTRGAGKSWYIGRQAQALIDSMVEYQKVVGHYPSSEELGAALDIDLDYQEMSNYSEHNREWSYAQQTLIHGALQMAASKLLEQRTQEAAGRQSCSMMSSGLSGFGKRTVSTL
jgi:hypothetical protein